MSKSIKVHTPAGRVCTAALPHPTGRPTPFEEFEDATDTAPHDVGAETEEMAGVRTHDGPAAGETDLEQRLREEFQAGFDEGRRYGEKSLKDVYEAQLTESATRVASLIANLTQRFVDFRAAAERDIVRLAIAIAERVVKREIQLDKEFVIRQIHEAMKRVIGVDRMRIRINPADEEFVRARRNELLSSADAVRELTLEADETIPRGSCVLESDAGNVDAGVQTQLERIEAALLSDQETR